MMYIEEYNKDYEAISIPPEVYEAICDELKCKSISFMGIS